MDMEDMMQRLIALEELAGKTDLDLRSSIKTLVDEVCILRWCLEKQGGARPEVFAAAQHHLNFERTCARSPLATATDFANVHIRKTRFSFQSQMLPQNEPG